MSETLSNTQHQDMAATVYSAISWGNDRDISIKQHGPRLQSTLRYLHDRSPLSANQAFLDIGAGVGVLEHFLVERFSGSGLNLVALEPVPALAKFLQEKYPDIQVWNDHLEHIDTENVEARFDMIFCLGVDYLFRDLKKALAVLKHLARDRLVFSRNVFFDMPCYFGGRPILTFDDLVGPNPLISQFLYVDQYMELLSRYFNVSKGGWFTETFKDSIEARHLIVDCRVSDQPVQPAKPVRNPERAMARLRDLGISVN